MGQVSRYIRGNVLGLLALYVALGGTALALQANSVKSKHIQNGEVKRQDIAGAAVNSAKVANESLVGADIDEASLELDELPAGPPSGPAGGDLAGAYPNPELAANSVGGNQIANNTIPYIKLASPGTFHESDIGLSFENSAIRWGLEENGVQAEEIGAGAVGASEIATGAVGAAEIAANAVGGAKVADRSLSGADLAVNSVDGEEIVEITGHTSSITIPPGSWGEATATCAGGDTAAISGGAVWSAIPNSSAINPYLRIINSDRVGFASWRARGYNGYTVDPLTLVVSVYCV